MPILHKSPAVKEVKELLKQVGVKLVRTDIINRVDTGIYSVNDEWWVDIKNWEYGSYEDEVVEVENNKEDDSTRAKINEVVEVKDKLTLRRKRWVDVPVELKIDESRIGDRIWVAGVERTAKLTLAGIYDTGKKPYPVATAILMDAQSRKIPFYLDSCVRHPKNFKSSEVKKLFDSSVVGEKITVANTGKSADGKVSKKRGRKAIDIEPQARAWLKTDKGKAITPKNHKEMAHALCKGLKMYGNMHRPNHQVHSLAVDLFDERQKGLI
jgi:hypothetical protein